MIVIEEAPTDPDQNQHPGLPYLSGMLQSWNKFCFTTGYIEVSVIFPGQADVAGYVSALRYGQYYKGLLMRLICD